ENYHLISLQLVYASGISEVMEREPTDSYVIEHSGHQRDTG
ncbi:hypothetical protein LEMLEM_LOCUS10282, partial [Lemmus lemmus]